MTGVIGIHRVARRCRLSRAIKRRCYPVTRLVLSGILAVSACTAMSGCYLSESAYGQLSLLSKREPIERVITRPSTPEAVRLKLEEIADIRRFASHDLGLPENGSYRSYARISRDYVVWTVVAAPEFSIEPRLWCYPIVGCVAYRGYFAESEARAFAAHWSKKGFDVTIDGVAAGRNPSVSWNVQAVPDRSRPRGRSTLVSSTIVSASASCSKLSGAVAEASSSAPFQHNAGSGAVNAGSSTGARRFLKSKASAKFFA